MLQPRLQIAAQDSGIPEVQAQLADGHGRLGDIRLADRWFSRSVTCYCSNVGGQGLPQVDATHSYVQLNRGSLIEFLNAGPINAGLSKGFLGIFGGSSEDQIRKAWNDYMAQREHQDRNGSIPVNIVHEGGAGLRGSAQVLRHHRNLQQEGYDVVYNTWGRQQAQEDERCRVFRGGEAKEKIVIAIEQAPVADLSDEDYNQRITRILNAILPSIGDHDYGIHEIEICVPGGNDRDERLTNLVNVWKAEHFMPQQKA